MVLRVLATAVEDLRVKANEAVNKPKEPIRFVPAGSRAQKPIIWYKRPSVLVPKAEWKLKVDLDFKKLIFPIEILLTNLHPDMVVWSVPQKTVIIVELTVLWEDNLEWAHSRKREKYADLKAQCEERGWTCLPFFIRSRV